MTADRDQAAPPTEAGPLVQLWRVVAWVFRRCDGQPVFVLKTAIFASALTFVLLTLLNAIHRLPDLDDAYQSAGKEIIVNLIVAPLLENLAMAGLIELLDAHARRWRSIVIVVALVSGGVHAIGFGWRGIAGAIVFATMSYSYLLWRDRGFLTSFRVTVAQHALFNVPATVVAILLH